MPKYQQHIRISFHCSPTHVIEFNVLNNTHNNQPDLLSLENLSAVTQKIAEKLNDDEPEDWGSYLNRIFHECHIDSICEVKHGPTANTDPSTN